MIRFFNTLSGKLETFQPLRKGQVGLYSCGPTVYDYAHIGNFRTFVFEDLLRRFFEFKGFKVKHVMNITDVDDKTIAGAARDSKKLDDFTGRYLQAFWEDMKILNILPANHPKEAPRATQEISVMIALAEKLLQKGIAYVRAGSVYYRVSAFRTYGKLSKKRLEKNKIGARVDADEYEKEEGSDFALWKKAKPGEPAWDSPWGKGRPGWHLECSAMSMKYLGETFDLHAGGEDLIFPHHENEIAQSEAATGQPFVRYWLHCKHLLVNGEKMSKTKGNFYTLRDLLGKSYDAMAIRYALLAVHYRAQLNFTLEGLKESEHVIKKLDDCYYRCLSLADVNSASEVSSIDEGAFKMQPRLCNHLNKMTSALEDDLNISVALSRLVEAVRDMNSWSSYHDLRASLYFFKQVDRLFGLDIAHDEQIPMEVTRIRSERVKLRGQPDFARNQKLQGTSDQLRTKIETLGWEVKDGRPGEPSTVKKKRRAWD